jgi:alkaline phosphatase
MITHIQNLWGITIDAQECHEICKLADGDAGSLSYALARVISKNHTAIGWTSHGHNAEDVPLWAFGPGAPSGLVDNTELANMVAVAFGLDMADIQDQLFVDLDDAFPGNWSLDESDPANPVAKVTVGAVNAELPINKNLLTIDGGMPIELEGVVVYASNTGKVYVPQEAVDMITGS